MRRRAWNDGMPGRLRCRGMDLAAWGGDPAAGGAIGRTATRATSQAR